MFGKGAMEALGDLKVEFLESPFGSIFPSEEDGHLVVNSSFIRQADLEEIYLDVVLSLNFSKKAADAGPSRRDSEEMGLDESPVMLESYQAMVKEGRRLGTPDAKLMERLQLPRFMMSPADFRKFVKAVGLKPGA